MAKIVGSCIYVHKSNKDDLFSRITDKQSLTDLQIAIATMDVKVGNYDVIKYDKKDHRVSFLFCDDFDHIKEPMLVGDIYTCYMADGFKWKTRKAASQIYHSKELLVADDYKGFNISKAKERTKEWNAIPGIKEHKKKIGNKDYWLALLKANGMEE